MATTNHDGTDSVPGNRIDDFESLYPRQVSYCQYRVLNLKEDQPTHNLVDLVEGECSCQDFQYNREPGEACKHLAVALFQASRTISVEEQAVSNLSEYVRDAKEAAEELMGVKYSAGDDSEVTDDPDPEPSTPEEKDWATLTESWLHQQGVDIDKLDIWEADNNGSVQIEANGRLEDDEFEVLSETDWIWYDGDNNRNYITEDNREEVLG